MRKESELKIANRWPGWFDLHGDPGKTLMCFGFAHGDGWFELVWRLCEEIEKVVDKERPFEVVEVKEKLGGLRFYTMEVSNEDVLRLIAAAGEESLHTCEVCGQPGSWDEGGRWIKTRCEAHRTVDGPLS